MLGYKGITAEKDTDFAIRLTKEIGVASIPTSVFLPPWRRSQDAAVLLCKRKRNTGKGGGKADESLSDCSPVSF
jgi:hypothetical protein